MNDKVIALIDMDCFYVQVNESRKHQIVIYRNIEGGGKGKAITQGGACCRGSGLKNVQFSSEAKF